MKTMMMTMTMMIRQIAQRKNMMKHRVNLIKEMMGIMIIVDKVILMEMKKARNNSLNMNSFSNSHTINLNLSFLCWH